jgi:DNA gyrase/topoisomerase IV subunit A
MTSAKDRVFDELLAWADLELDPSEFDEDSVRQQSPELYRAAIEAFGGWDRALGAALTRCAAKSGSTSKSRSSTPAPTIPSEPPPERVVDISASREGLAVSKDGMATRLPLVSFHGSREGVPEDFPDEITRQIIDFIPGEDDASLAVLTRGGELVSMLREQFPSHNLQSRWLGYESEDSAPLTGWRDSILRNKIRRHDRIYFFSRGGQVKASDAQEYARRVDSAGMPAIIIKEGDEAYSVTAGSKRSNICVASSLGKAIVFEPDDVRTQGLKAQGVKAISLDDDAHVVGAFLVEEPQSFLVATELGYGKLLDPQEFRSQGRGGAGLQTCRLGSGDRVALFTPVSLAEDVLLFTDQNRYVRIPAFCLPPMGRAARGEQIAQLADGERIVGGRVVPAGDFE